MARSPKKGRSYTFWLPEPICSDVDAIANAVPRFCKRPDFFISSAIQDQISRYIKSAGAHGRAISKDRRREREALLTHIRARIKQIREAGANG